MRKYTDREKEILDVVEKLPYATDDDVIRIGYYVAATRLRVERLERRLKQLEHTDENDQTKDQGLQRRTKAEHEEGQT